MTSWSRGAALTGLCLVLAACGGAQDGSAPAGSPVPTPTGSAPTQSGSTAGADPADVAAADLVPCPPSDPAVPAHEEGLPDVTLPCLGEGPDVRLAGLRGTPMVINVWASWCGPCRAELPVFGQVARQAGSAVQFLGIDYRDNRVAALELAGATGMGFASVQDPDQQVKASLRIVGLPATIFVRADGSIAGRSAVITDEAQLKAKIDEYLNVRVP